MKKFIYFIGLVAVCIGVTIFWFQRQSLLEIATEAEQKGDYGLALKNYIETVLKISESVKYPVKRKALLMKDAEWLEELKIFISSVLYTVQFDNRDYQKALDGIARCTSYVENVNFITIKKPEDFVTDSLFEDWKEAFVRENTNIMKEHEKLIKQAEKSGLSLLRIRTMNGYIYYVKFLNLKTGRRVDFTIYPNSNISLPVRKGNYLLICSSEVQFTQGLSRGSWYSPENIIPVIIPENPSIMRITLKTRVNRS